MKGLWLCLFNSLSFLLPKGCKNRHYCHRPWEKMVWVHLNYSLSAISCTTPVCPGGMLTAVPNGSTLNHPGHRETRSNTTLFRNSSFALWIPVAKANFVNLHIDHALKGQRPTTWLQLKNGEARKKKRKKKNSRCILIIIVFCSMS